MGHKAESREPTGSSHPPLSPVLELGDGGEQILEQMGLGSALGLFAPSLGKCVRRTPLRRISRITLASGADAYLKFYAPGAGRAGKVRGLCSPARVEWEMLRELQEEGLRVPHAICAVWGRRGDREASLLLLGGVPGSRPLDGLLGEQGCHARMERWLLESLVPFIHRFHGLGFQHRDLYACHLMVRPDLDQAPTLIDLARVRRSRRLGSRRLVKDLAALHHSLARHLRRSLLLRLFLRYSKARALDRRSRALLRAVLRKSARIARHQPLYG